MEVHRRREWVRLLGKRLPFFEKLRNEGEGVLPVGVGDLGGVVVGEALALVTMGDRDDVVTMFMNFEELTAILVSHFISDLRETLRSVATSSELFEGMIIHMQ